MSRLRTQLIIGQLWGGTRKDVPVFRYRKYAASLGFSFPHARMSPFFATDGFYEGLLVG
jgi:hypothetical protein